MSENINSNEADFNNFKKLHESLSKNELLELLYESLLKESNLTQKIIKLETRKIRSATKRTDEVLELLKNKPMKISDIANELDITNKNVSSIFVALRKQGIELGMNQYGEKMIWSHDYNNNEPQEINE